MKKIIIFICILIVGCSINNDLSSDVQSSIHQDIENASNNTDIKDYDETLGIGINSNNFPDDYFAEYIIDNIDLDKNNYLSNDEILNTKSICISRSGDGKREPENLKGIEKFVNLEELEFNDCYKILDIPLHNFPYLRKLKLNHMYIENIDISKNLELDSISIIYTNIKNISICSKTQSVDFVFDSTLSSATIDISNCPYFKNQISESYISGLSISTIGSDNGHIKVVCDNKDILCLYNNNDLGFGDRGNHGITYMFGHGDNNVVNKTFDSYAKAHDYGFNGNKWFQIIEHIYKEGLSEEESFEACYLPRGDCTHQYEVIVYDEQPF